MDKITVKAPAKINLCLDITNRLDNGYHSVFMIMQAVDLYDKVTVEKDNSKKIKVVCANEKVPADENNIAFKAAERFFEFTGMENPGIIINIEKNIPVAAGLAGGSTDAAAVLTGLNRLFDFSLSERELCKAGVKIGADVPFCIMGGTMLAQDFGQILSPLPDFEGFSIVLAKPDRSVSTKKAYDDFDSALNIRHPDNSRILRYAADGEYEKAFRYFENVFEQVVEVPERAEIKTIMRETGASFALMSGSGPSVYGVFKDEKNAKECMKKCEKICEGAFLCRCVDKGCIIME